jgi:hypothetical protein
VGRFPGFATVVAGCLAGLLGYNAVSGFFEQTAQAAIDVGQISAERLQLALSRFGSVSALDAPTARFEERQDAEPLTANDYLSVLRTLRAPRRVSTRQIVSTTDAGPGRLELTRFFAARESGEAQFWIEATLPEIPNLALLPKAFAEIEIEHVQRADGVDVYAGESRFETAFFRALALEADSRAGVYSGVRAVRVAGSVRGRDIAYVTGRLALTLPIEAEAISFAKDETGVERMAASEATAELTAMGGGEVAFRTTGRPEAYVAVYAYDRQGRRLAPAGESVRANGMTAERKALFHGEAARIEVIFTRGFLRKTYPFVLEGAGAPRPLPFGPEPKASVEPAIV